MTMTFCYDVVYNLLDTIHIVGVSRYNIVTDLHFYTVQSRLMQICYSLAAWSSRLSFQMVELQ